MKCCPYLWSVWMDVGYKTEVEMLKYNARQKSIIEVSKVEVNRRERDGDIKRNTSDLLRVA